MSVTTLPLEYTHLSHTHLETPSPYLASRLSFFQMTSTNLTSIVPTAYGF